MPRPLNSTERERNAVTVACPACSAKAGSVCLSTKGGLRVHPHKERVEAALELLAPDAADDQRTFKNMREICETFFPTSHAAKTCRCYPKPQRGILVIQPRSGRQIRVI